MKISTTKFASVLLSISILLTMLCFPLNVIADETVADKVFLKPTIQSSIENAYENYYIKYNNESYATAEVSLTVDEIVDNEPVSFIVNVPCKGLYTIGMSYCALGNEIDDLQISLLIDNQVPFYEANTLVFPRFWHDEEKVRVDSAGNEFPAKQVPFEEERYAEAQDIKRENANPYLLFLSEGEHSVTIKPVDGSFKLNDFTFGVAEQLEKYQKPSVDDSTAQNTIYIQGENAFIRNDYGIPAKSDNASANVTPHSATATVINYIGGDNWKTPGQTIVWKTPKVNAGYYQIGFSYRQNYVIGGEVYRNLKIDGETPFTEAAAIPFKYDDNWQKDFFADENDVPYLFYLSEGAHEISLTVVPGNMERVKDYLKYAVSELSSLYIDITMITGETPDTYRDYNLFEQISDMEDRLDGITNQLNAALSLLEGLTGQESGSNQAILRNMNRVIAQMQNNRYSAHRYKSEYYTRYTALAATLYDMQNMPLDIDSIILASPGTKESNNNGFLNKCQFSISRFFVSFVRDYTAVSKEYNKNDSVNVWVNWGRDQAQILNLLSRSEFSSQSGITVDIQLVNASIIQAILSGKGPDVILQQSRSEPVNLAMRGALYDLSRFEDVDTVLQRFNDGAEIPYRYNGGLYALPDTQQFFLMYYRADILSELGFEIPETWDEFKELSSLLARRNLQVWIPNNPATSIAQTNAGVGSINIFPTLVMQNGLSLYNSEGTGTTLTSPDIMKIFGEWTDLYRKYKISTVMDFYNRFRTGICPLGIDSYSLYVTLKTAAPEIDGLWNVALIPGTVNDNGVVSHISAGSGTGCAILKNAKNPEVAWEFLKWWTNAETQINYSNELEAVLGPSGRISPSNKEAFKSLSWDASMKEQIMQAKSQVVEIPEYPGSYYISRSLYQSFWNVVELNQNPKDMLLKYGKQADAEIQRKWAEYDE